MELDKEACINMEGWEVRGGGGVILSFLWFLAHLQDLSSSRVGKSRPQFLTANTFSEKGIYC